MFCVSVCQESRRQGLADMVNAAPQCDLIELRLDKFSKAPEIKEFLEAKPKPMIVSCRRPQDGGAWQGTEDARLSLLRQAVLDKADYVEIELDVADQVRRYGSTKRIISYTNMSETPRDLADVYAEAQKKGPDVIKLTTLARTPAEAWPLLQILNKATVPTIAVGLGKPGVMLAVLGRKVGAPWAYGALERGMEAYPGQPTVAELREVYHLPDIDKATRLIGVTGFTEPQYATVAALNAGFAALKMPVRCLPMEAGGVNAFRRVVEAFHLAAVLIDDANRAALFEVATECEESARAARAIDVLVRREQKWVGYNALWRAGTAALENALQARQPGEKPLSNKVVMLVGAGGTTRAMAFGVKRRGGVPIIAGRDADEAQFTAQMFECRHILFEAIYSTMHEALVVCNIEPTKKTSRSGEAGVHSGYLKPSMAVMDLSALPRSSPLIRDARLCGCATVHPRELMLTHLSMQFKLIAGQDAPRAALEQALTRAVPDEQ
jgi:3-dehydroquinate dehydratase/shikimate dehydrogenase